MSEQIQIIKDRQVCCWGSSLVTYTNGKDVNEAFKNVQDFCTFFCAIGNWDTDRYARITDADLVYGVGAYHLNADNTIYPEPYSSISDNVDFAAPTDLRVLNTTFDGTSCAQPVLLGMAVLFCDFIKDKTGSFPSSAMVYQFLKDNSHDFDIPGKDTKTGWGYVTLPHPDTIDIAKYATKESDTMADKLEMQQASDWAMTAWQTAFLKGICDGQRPFENITRQEVITMLYRAGVIK